MTPLARVQDGAAAEVERSPGTGAAGSELPGVTAVESHAPDASAALDRTLRAAPRTSREVTRPLSAAVAERLAARLLPY